MTFSDAELEQLRADLQSYEERDNSNYYGRLIRLQATEFNCTPRLLARLDAAEAVCAIDAEVQQMGYRYPSCNDDEGREVQLMQDFHERHEELARQQTKALAAWKATR